MQLLDKARRISTTTNLDINKQEILLLLRMKKQARAADALQQYMGCCATMHNKISWSTMKENG